MTTGGWCSPTSRRSSASRVLLLWVTRLTAHGCRAHPGAIVASHSSSCSAVRQFCVGNAPSTPALAAATTSSVPDTRNIGPQRPEAAAMRAARVVTQSPRPSLSLGTSARWRVRQAEQPLEHLADGVAGQLVTHLEPLGQLERGDAPLAQPRDELVEGQRLPGRSTTTAATRSPSRSSGSPMTATSATAGWSAMSPSSSAGAMFMPPRITWSRARSR